MKAALHTIQIRCETSAQHLTSPEALASALRELGEYAARVIAKDDQAFNADSDLTAASLAELEDAVNGQ